VHICNLKKLLCANNDLDSRIIHNWGYILNVAAVEICFACMKMLLSLVIYLYFICLWTFSSLYCLTSGLATLSLAVDGLPMRERPKQKMKKKEKETLSSFIMGSTRSYHHNLLTGPKSPKSDFHRELVSLCNSYHLDHAWRSD